MAMGFIKTEVDPKLYFTLVGNDPLILVLYVDDVFLTSSKKLIEMCKRDLTSEFEMDIDMMHYFMGLEVWKQKSEIYWDKKNMSLIF